MNFIIPNLFPKLLNTICSVQAAIIQTLVKFNWVPQVVKFSLGHFLGRESIFTSHVSGQGNRMGPLCVPVCNSALSQQNCLMYEHKFWYGDTPL